MLDPSDVFVGFIVLVFTFVYVGKFHKKLKQLTNEIKVPSSETVCF